MGRVYDPDESDGASWVIMRCQTEVQAVRAVEMSRPGGRDGPQSSFVAEVKMDFGDWLDILTLKRRGATEMVVKDDGKLNCDGKAMAVLPFFSLSHSERRKDPRRCVCTRKQSRFDKENMSGLIKRKVRSIYVFFRP